MAEIPLLDSNEHPKAKMIKLMDILTDEDATAEDMKEAADMISKHETSPEEQFEIPAVKFKNEQQEADFGEQIKLALTDLENYVKTKGIVTFEQLASENPVKYLRIKISGENKRRSGIFLQENLMKSCTDVFIKNFFETHGISIISYRRFSKYPIIAPEDQKVKAEGHFEYSFDSFWKDYGVSYTAIDNEERKVLYHLLSDAFNLEVQEKRNFIVSGWIS